ncbi:hypothetical protein Tco_0865259 [Tanacetum coccineum]
MASFDYRLNPLYAIKECSSCGTLYTGDCGCSKGSLEDKILVSVPDSFKRNPPIPDLSQRPLKIEKICLDCGDPVHGLYCRQCALIRKTLEEVFQDFQDTSKSSDDDTNFVNQEPFVVKQGPGVNSSQSPPQINHNCCYECGDSLDDIFCQRCTCKSCGKGAHYGYNCPPQIPIISNPEPCYNQNLNEILQNLQSLQQQCLFGTCQQCGCNEYDGVCFYCTVGNGTPINFSTPYSSNDSPSVANHPPQPQYVPYSCELCGNDSHYGYDCPPQVPFVYNQDPCFNQNFDYFPQTSPSFHQQYPCCENCGGPHETFQCQPMNEDYYHEQNSCYDSNSFGFDQFQPPQYTVNHPISNVQNSLFNAQNEFLNSQNKLMEQMTSMCDMVGQLIQKKEEEKRIEEEQAAKDRYWKIPVCYDDDDDEESSIPLKDTIISGLPPSSVENLFPSPSEPEDFSDIESECDVLICDNLTNFSNPLFDANEDVASSDEEEFKISSNPLFDLDEKSLRNRDTSLIFFKIVSLLDEFHRFQNHCCGGKDIHVDVPNILPTHPALHLDFDFISSNDLGSDLDVSSPSGDRNKIYDPGICIEVESTRLLSTLSPVIDTLLQFSSENKDKVFNHSVLASKEKSSSSLSHRGFKASKLFHQKSPMLIFGDNTPNLGVRHPHFYPP